MKLLFITQKLDTHDDVLGFVHRWVLEFSKHTDILRVLCLEQGAHDLPQNVAVHSLGKERYRIPNSEFRILRKVKYAWRFLRYIVRARRDYDTVFVHMNQIYCLLGFPVWKILGKKVFLWYAHGHTPFSLRVAEKLVRGIFTSTPCGCRLRSGKIRVVGQGIDTDYFTPSSSVSPPRSRLIMVGRISPVKDHGTLLKAVALLKESMPLSLSIIGKAGTVAQEQYETRLKTMIETLGLGGRVIMEGAVAHEKILPYLQKSDMFLNPSLTGSLDKAGLEAMAVGMPVVTCNEAYKDVLGEYAPMLLFEKGDYEGLARVVLKLYTLPSSEWATLQRDMRAIVVLNHGVTRFAEKIISIMSQS